MLQCHAKLPVLFIVCICLFGAGCVEGQVQTFVKYDDKDDSFKCLQIYTNLLAIDNPNVDRLESLWKRRQSIIIDPVQISSDYTVTAFGRKGANQYCIIDLAKPGNEEEKTIKADLDTIKVIPGEFYLNKHGNLSYYHQNVVPGKIVDVAIMEFTPKVAKLMAEDACHQISLAKDANVKRLTWDDLRKMALESVSKKPAVRSCQGKIGCLHEQDTLSQRPHRPPV